MVLRAVGIILTSRGVFLLSKNPFKDFSFEKIKNKVPDFTTKVPSEDEFMKMADTDLGSYIQGEIGIDLGPISQLNNTIEGKLDGVKQSFIDKAKESIGVDLSEISMPGNIEDYERLAYKYGPKIGIPQGAFDKYEELKSKVDDVKELAKEKSIEHGTQKAKELGIDIPNVPSEEELVQMIADTNPDAIASIDEKIAAIEQFIQSKLNS